MSEIASHQVAPEVPAGTVLEQTPEQLAHKSVGLPAVNNDINPEPQIVDDPESPTGKSVVYRRYNGEFVSKQAHTGPVLVNQDGAASVSAPDTVIAPPVPNPADPANLGVAPPPPPQTTPPIPSRRQKGGTTNS